MRKKENNSFLLLAFKLLTETLLVAMLCTWSFRIVASLQEENKYNPELLTFSHFIFVTSIIIWCIKKYKVIYFFKKQSVKIILFCPIIAVLILICLIYIGTIIYIPNIYRSELHSFHDSYIGILTLGVIQPIAEEILFRGTFMSSLLKWKKNPWWAISITTIIFSCIHLNISQIIGTFVFGFIAGWLFYKTNSLYPSIIIHITNNSICCLLGKASFCTTMDQFIDCNKLFGLLVIIPACLGLLIYIICIIQKK